MNLDHEQRMRQAPSRKLQLPFSLGLFDLLENLLESVLVAYEIYGLTDF